jgi:serine/threonine-protein kinase
MTGDSRIQQLLDELLDSHATPEQVCGSCPKLLPVVRERWQRLCRLQAGLEAMHLAHSRNLVRGKVKS